MKARVKATGEIVEVYFDFRGMKHDFLDEKGKGYMSDELTIFDNEISKHRSGVTAGSIQQTLCRNHFAVDDCNVCEIKRAIA